MPHPKPKSSISWAQTLGALAVWGIAILMLDRKDHLRWAEDGPAAPPTPQHASALDGLLKWARDRGAKIGFEVREGPDSDRSAFATRAYAAGDFVAMIPGALHICLSNNGGFPAEHAHALAIQMASNTSFLTEYGPYFATLPLPGRTLGSEAFTDDLVTALQAPELETIVNRERAVMAAVFMGRYRPQDGAGKAYPSLRDALAAAGADPNAFPLPLFAHLAVLISSREFVFYDGKQRGPDRLVPVADMLNNNGFDGKNNVQQWNDGDNLYLRATRPIAAGEELFLPYLPGLDHRPDMTLTGYGFVRPADAGASERPLLAAIDLPTFDPEQPYAPTPASDRGFYGPRGSHNTEEEEERLRGLLAVAATTVEEDEAALAAKGLDWKMRSVLEFRVARKRALEAAIEAIQEARLGSAAA